MFIGNVKEIYIMIESDIEGSRVLGVNTHRDDAARLCKFFSEEKKNRGKTFNFVTINLVDFVQALFDPDCEYVLEIKDTEDQDK